MSFAIVAINIGTSKVVAASADVTGGRQSVFEEALTAQNHTAWLESLSAAAKKLPVLAKDSILSFCGTSGSFLLTDKYGDPIGPPVMYNQESPECLPEVIQRTRSCLGIDPDLLTAEGPVVKLFQVWHSLSPEARNRVRWVLPQSVWLTYRVSRNPGEVWEGITADTANCRKLGGNGKSMEWAKDLYESLGIPKDILPEIVPSGTKVGEARGAFAEPMSLAGAMVYHGMTDANADSMALIGDKIGEVGLVVGSTTSLKAVLAETVDVGPEGYVAPNILNPAKYTYTAWVSVGENLKKLSAISGIPLQSLISEAWKRDDEGIPSLRLRRALIVDEKNADDPIGSARGVLESAAYWEAYQVDFLERALGSPIQALHLVGGTARSAELMQLRANACGKTLHVYGAGSALGTLVPALVRNGYVGSGEEFLNRFRIPIKSISPGSQSENSLRRKKAAWELIEAGADLKGKHG